VVAKAKMKRHVNTIIIFPAIGVEAGSVAESIKWPTKEKIKKHMHIHAAPTISAERRLQTLTIHKPKIVATTLTVPNIIEVTNESLIPVAWKIVVP